MSDLAKKKETKPGQIREIYMWNEDRTDLVVKDTEDLEEVMKERAKGVSIYELIEKHGALELIPGYGADTVKSDGKLHYSADQDFTDIPEFGTDILNKQMEESEKKLQADLAAAEKAKADAEAAKQKAIEDAKAREEFIKKQMEASKGEDK